jgi:hypothetical protein
MDKQTIIRQSYEYKIHHAGDPSDNLSTMTFIDIVLLAKNENIFSECALFREIGSY